MSTKSRLRLVRYAIGNPRSSETAARTEHAALRALARKYPDKFLAIRERIRAQDPEPVRPRAGGEP